jgi:hypothetical protein
MAGAKIIERMKTAIPERDAIGATPYNRLLAARLYPPELTAARQAQSAPAGIEKSGRKGGGA